MSVCSCVRQVRLDEGEREGERESARVCFYVCVLYVCDAIVREA